MEIKASSSKFWWLQRRKESSRRVCVRVSVFTHGKLQRQGCLRDRASFIRADRCLEEGKCSRTQSWQQQLMPGHSKTLNFALFQPPFLMNWCGWWEKSSLLCQTASVGVTACLHLCCCKRSDDYCCTACM